MKKTAKLSVKKWIDEVYGVQLILLVGPYAKAHKWMVEHFGIDSDDIGIESGAKTVWLKHETGFNALVFWFPIVNIKDVHDLGIIAHEALHGTNFVMSTRGLTLSIENDEPYAYYIGWLFRELYRRLS